MTQRTREGRRRELLAAALRAIREHGADASMADIAAVAGITKPILYRHFGDRDGLIVAVADDFATELVARIDQALATGSSTEDRIRGALGAYVDFIADDVELYDYLAQRTAVGSDVYIAVVDRVAATIRRALEDLAEPGVPDGAVVTWAYGIAGMAHLAGAQWVRAGGRSRDDLVEQLVSLVLHGLPAPAASDDSP